MNRSNSLFIDSEYEKDCIDKINYFSDFTNLGNLNNSDSEIEKGENDKYSYPDNTGIVDGIVKINDSTPLYADDRYRCISCKENNGKLWKNIIRTTTKPTIRIIEITYSTTSCHNKKHENVILIYF